jgi:hypothetical protein
MKENSENRRSKQTRNRQNFVGKPPQSRIKYDKHLESRDLCQIMP